MIRFTMLFLCMLLAAAAFGRYRAEVSVRDVRAEMSSQERERRQLETDIKILRAEIAYLENPNRLKKIAAATTDLQPLVGNQLVSATGFLSIVSPDVASKLPVLEDEKEDMDYAVAVIDLGTVQ